MTDNATKGKELEDAVAALFMSAGENVEREQLLGHKKVDLIIRQTRWGAPWVVAVECKNYGRSLTKRQVVEIWMDYCPIIETGLVNELLIVTTQSVAPSALAYVRSSRQLQVQDLPTLTHELLRIDKYLAELQAAYNESSDGLSHYYIRPKLINGEDAEDILYNWISGTEAHLDLHRPLAVLGAYGLGKSSLASRLAARLAREASVDPTKRIPILVRLGEIAGTQDIPSLLGKHFTDTHHVRGYSYELFQELNRTGRLVIILDGFDEMKQLLSWREFKYNLSQLNRLFHPNGRLVLLGRPTAFENDDEQEQALHGLRRTRFGARAEPGAPDYQELELGLLGPEQVREFIDKYLSWKTPTFEGDDGKERVLKQLEAKQLSDVAKRPVQLRMLAEILPHYTGDISRLDLVDIYELFIDQLIDDVMSREEEKQARLRFSAKDRRTFLQSFAFWLWTQNGAEIVTTDQIPLALVEDFVADEDPEAVRRDLVVGSPLDRRAGERVRFAHKSFQEFLVAEVIWSRLQSGQVTFSEANGWITGEVSSFMGLLQETGHNTTSLQQLRSLSGQLSWKTVKAAFLDTPVVTALIEKATSSPRLAPWELTALAAGPIARNSETSKALHEAIGKSTLQGEGERFGPDSLLAVFTLLRCWGVIKSPEALLTSLLAGMLGGAASVERISGTQVAKRGLVMPISQNVLGDLRANEMRLGTYVGGTRVISLNRKSRYVVQGGEYVNVKWLPQEVISLAERAASKGAGRFDVRGWRGIFASTLPAIAFVEEWLDGGSLSRTVDLPTEVTLTDPRVEDALKSLAQDWSRYFAAHGVAQQGRLEDQRAKDRRMDQRAKATRDRRNGSGR